MSNKFLHRANIWICAVIAIGFMITSFVGFKANSSIYIEDVENVSRLTAESIFFQIQSVFTKPVNVSLTMANDNFLRDYLIKETENEMDEQYIKIISGYLNRYREEYDYDSVFLVSSKSGRYYNYNGINRMMNMDNPENKWYFDFLNSGLTYSLNVDNDEAADNEITVFVNCRIFDREGNTAGIVGVGVRIEHLQELLKEYGERFSVNTCLIDKQGVIEISADQSGYEPVNLFKTDKYEDLDPSILTKASSDGYCSYWHESHADRTYFVIKYVKELDWYLLVENDTGAFYRKQQFAMLGSIVLLILIIIFILWIVYKLIQKYNNKILEINKIHEDEQQRIFREATEQLYDNIYEINITKNCAEDENTENYFVSLGIRKDASYDEGLQTIAEKQIREEFREAYLTIFSRTNVQKVFDAGKNSLQYEFMTSMDGKNYYWIRISAYIYSWRADNSVHMYIYRQNIDAEKRLEEQMLEKANRDPMTKVYNKEAVRENINQILKADPLGSFAFFIIDIDNFKDVNDRYGHVTGDAVIIRFVKIIQKQFRKSDIIGRVGGDEFVVFLTVSGREWTIQKAKNLSKALHAQLTADTNKIRISASIGIALSPLHGMSFDALYKNADIALYETKNRGKNGFSIFGEDESVMP